MSKMVIESKSKIATICLKGKGENIFSEVQTQLGKNVSKNH